MHSKNLKQALFFATVLLFGGNLSAQIAESRTGQITGSGLSVNSVDSTHAVNGGLINSDLRVSTLDSGRVAPGGLTQSDIRVSSLDSSRIAPGGLTQSDLRVSTLDSSRIAPVSLTDSDIRVSTITAGKVTPLFLKSLTGNGISLIKQRTATSWEFKKLVGTFGTGGTSFITDATDSVRIDFEPFFKAAAPIQFSVDSASAMAADTMWVWRNVSSGSVVIDSINVDASSDDYAISIVKRNSGGGLGALVDAVTASTNGTNTFYTTETTITSATVPRFGWIGFKRPTSTGKRVSVRIHYH